MKQILIFLFGFILGGSVFLVHAQEISSQPVHVSTPVLSVSSRIQSLEVPIATSSDQVQLSKATRDHILNFLHEISQN